MATSTRPTADSTPSAATGGLDPQTPDARTTSTIGERPGDADRTQPEGQPWIVGVFLLVPLSSLLLVVPAVLAGWVSTLDLALAAGLYLVTAFGITVGYHRLFTHGSFKARRGLRVTLAVCGSLALEGTVADWVADHRKHHKYSDLPGDPHSPWRFGTDARSVAKGLVYAHIGWLLRDNPTDVERYAPDLMADRDIAWMSRRFPWFVAATLLLPAVLGGLLTWSWWGALTAFFWAGLVRITLVHQVTWAINSVCHVWGRRPFRTRDYSTNVAWLALPSLGESWHNYHHADPTAARHGVLRGQLDVSAASIRAFERLGWAHDVRWPTARRVTSRLIEPDGEVRLHRSIPPTPAAPDRAGAAR